MDNVDFADKNLCELLDITKCDDKRREYIKKTLLHLSCCHTVGIDEKNNYLASSPDELALVSFAKKIGYEFYERDQKTNHFFIKHKKIS